jgi:hypothetical protein
MIKINAKTLADAMFRAAPFVARGAECTRCIKTAGPRGRWIVTLQWPQEVVPLKPPVVHYGAEEFQRRRGAEGIA